jgi:hypothetical protein
MDSKVLAKQAVHFAAAKRLYELGALDEQLVPVRPSVPDKIDEYFKSLTSKAIPDEDETEAEPGEIVKPPSAQDSNADTAETAEDFFINATWYRKRVK